MKLRDVTCPGESIYIYIYIPSGVNVKNITVVVVYVCGRIRELINLR